MSSERFRRRIAEIASADEGALGDSARERIVSCVMERGPALVRRARWKRRMMYSAGPLLAAAAAVAFLVRTEASAPRAGSVAATNGVTPPAPTVACAARPAPAVRDFAARSGGAALDLGEVAFAIADPGSSVRAERLESCRTVIELASGRVTVHAKNLGGGELSVRAPSGLVTVKGTLFSVAQSADALVVEVAEGVVSVDTKRGEHLVRRGERLHLSSVGIAQGTLDGEREHALRAVVGVPEVVGFEALPSNAAAAAETPAAIEPPAPAPRAALVARSRVVAAAVEAEESAPGAVEEKVEAPVETPPAEAPPAPAPPKAETPVDWLTQAEQARKAGKFAEARTLYRRVAEQGSGAMAEAAWVSLARMELSLGHPAAARDATKRRQERFGHGTLEPEALWIDVRTYRQSGDVPRARALAEELVRRWPKAPQARAAEQWLSSGE